MKDSHCIYCDSTSYGRPCLFSPTSTHVHMDEPGKCIYCGSPYLGTGCMFNPYGNIHIRGPEFLSNSAIRTEKAAVLTYVLNMASKMLEENERYRSPLDRLYKRVASIISSIAEPLLEALCLQETPTYGNLTKQQIIHTVDYKNKFKKQLKEFSKTVQEASIALPQEIVEKTLVDAIMDFDDREDQA